jgi:hypothetical protein
MKRLMFLKLIFFLSATKLICRIIER